MEIDVKKFAAIGIVLALTACNQAPQQPASPEYWQQKMCVQPRYNHLDKCKAEQEDNSAAIIGVISQM